MILLNDCIAGTFTNRDTYLPRLQESIDKYLPKLPFLIIKHDGAVNDGMTLLMNKFNESRKRFHLYTDDDIVFLDSDIIENSIITLMAYKWAASIVYMTYNKLLLTIPYDTSKLISRPTTVLLGYFLLVDSFKIEGILPDMNLPYGHISVDTDFGLAIKARGFEIGIANSYVYHEHKEDKNTQDMYLKTNEYLINKWGKSFFEKNVKDADNVVDLK